MGKGKTEVVLVDKRDRVLGRAEKIAAHKAGKLHRSFSIFIFNSKGELLLQRRADKKYHSAGLWSNACCSHPRPGRDLIGEARRRLKEEMGIQAGLKEAFGFIYKAKLGDLFEYEFDHVLVGRFDGIPRPNKDEAEAWQWVSPAALKKDIKKRPKRYSFWFKKALNRAVVLSGCKVKKGKI